MFHCLRSRLIVAIVFDRCSSTFFPLKTPKLSQTHRTIGVGRNHKRSCPNHPVSNIDETCAWIFLSEVINQSALGAQQSRPALIVTSINGKGHSTAENRWDGHSLESSILHPTHTLWQLVTSGMQDRRHHRKSSYATTALFRNVKRCCCQQEGTLNYELKCTQ